jgi:hypothetical protein
MRNRLPNSEAHPSTISHIDTIQQAVVPHVCNLTADDSILLIAMRKRSLSIPAKQS